MMDTRQTIPFLGILGMFVLSSVDAGSPGMPMKKTQLPSLSVYTSALRFVYLRPNYPPIAITLNLDGSPYRTHFAGEAAHLNSKALQKAPSNPTLSKIDISRSAEEPKYSCYLKTEYGRDGTWLIKDSLLLCQFGVESIMSMLMQTHVEAMKTDTSAFLQDSLSVWRLEGVSKDANFSIDSYQRKAIIGQPRLRNICFEMLNAAGLDTIDVR
jgi:hypothetical protein